MEQKEVWKNRTATLAVSDIERAYQNPAVFQCELVAFINQICHQNNYKKVIEIGCEMGVTSMLLDDTLDKTFLDFNEDILDKVKVACGKLGKQGQFVSEDMFSMSLPDQSYDLIFNAGVIEHYTYEERIALLKSYSRILNDQGVMVLAVPNHYCAPYRGAYVLRKEWLNSKRWPWPPEYKIYDLAEELKAASLQLVQRVTFDRQSAYTFWRYSVVRKLVKLTDALFNYEGYLTVLLIKKL